MEETLQIDTSIQVRREIFIDLYKQAFPQVASYIKRRGGTLEEAKDIFHDAIIAYYENILVNKQEPCHPAAYLFGIVRHQWCTRLSQKHRWESKEALEHPQVEEKDEYTDTSKLLKFLRYSGEKCISLLTDFYFHKISLENIARNFGFAGVRSATVQKYKCLEKLRDVVKDKKLNYEDFFE